VRPQRAGGAAHVVKEEDAEDAQHDVELVPVRQGSDVGRYELHVRELPGGGLAPRDVQHAVGVVHPDDAPRRSHALGSQQRRRASAARGVQHRVSGADAGVLHGVRRQILPESA
jgi:hypothetical protein